MSTYIVGHDGSPNADEALRVAARLGNTDRDMLVIVFVRHDQSTLAASTQATAIHHQALDEIANTITATLERTLTDYPGAWSFEQRHGNPATELVAAAHAHRADTIIVGHQGHTTLHDLVIGSAAHNLLAHSPVAVIVPRPAR